MQLNEKQQAVTCHKKWPNDENSSSMGVSPNGKGSMKIVMQAGIILR